MQRVKLNLSERQMSRLRNGHSVRILPKLVGSGADVIIDPMNYHNLMKHIKRNKGMMLNLTKDTIEVNKMEGSGIFKKIKKAGKKVKGYYNNNIKDTALGQALRDTAENVVEYGYDNASRSLQSNQFTNPLGEYMMDKREQNVDRVVRKTGLGLRLKGEGLKVGRGRKSIGVVKGEGAKCPHCKQDIYRDKFIFSKQSI